jgi:tetratricopeptide (TPR) repeat protein
MRYLIYLVSLFFIGCVSQITAMPIDTAKYDSAFLKASYLAEQGKTDDAIVILNIINKDVKDEYVVLKLSDLYLIKNQKEKALEVLNEAIASNKLKNSDVLWYQKSKIEYAIDGNSERAIKSIKKAISINESEDYLKLLATYYAQNKDFASAINIYDKLIKMNPNSDYYYFRGKLYLEIDLEQKAIEDLKKSVELDGNTRAALTLSELFIKKENYSEAIKYLEAIKDSEAVELLIKYKLGELYLKQMENDKAIKVFEEIIPKVNGKEYYYILKQLAKLYFESKNYEKANEYFTKLSDTYNDDIQAAYFAGITSEAIDDLEKAKKYYEKALKITPDFAYVLKRMAYISYIEKKYEKALKYLSSIKDEDRDVEFYRIKSLVYEGKKDENLQMRAIEEGLSKFKNSEDLLFDKAILLEKQKKYDETINILENLVKNNPNNASYLNFLGYLYADLNKNIKVAYEYISKALKLEPENPAYLDSMAWVLYRMGKYEDAYFYQKKAIKKTPNEEEMKKHLKAILKALNSNKTIEDVLQED